MVWSTIASHSAFAHWADLSVAEILVQDSKVSMTLTLPTELVNFADRDRNGQLSTDEVRQSNSELESFLAERIQMKAASGQVGKLHLDPNVPANSPAVDTTNRHSTVQLTYQWTEPIRDLTLHYDLFLPGVSTAQCLATVLEGDRTQSIVFTPTQKDVTLSQGLNWRSAARFITLGIEHILTGYDHILFLVSLLLLGGTLGNLVKLVTAFTIAHSITLTLAVLNLVTAPPALIESLVALSIVYVASENLWCKEAKHRWFVTFCFGLVHGLGFARILQDMNLTGSDLAISLISFNLGVELGQIGIVTLAFLMLKWLRQFQWHRRFQRMISWMMIAIGLIWFLERAFSLQIP
jgi:uncharacterized membrane protein YidH (DUF202 family)